MNLNYQIDKSVNGKDKKKSFWLKKDKSLLNLSFKQRLFHHFLKATLKFLLVDRQGPQY